MTALIVSLPAFAQRDSSYSRSGDQSVTDALTGANPVAPITTGLGQVVPPIISSPLTEPDKRQKQAEGLVTPYPAAPLPQQQPATEKTDGSYYEKGVRESGQYYPSDVKMDRREGTTPQTESGTGETQAPSPFSTPR